MDFTSARFDCAGVLLDFINGAANNWIKYVRTIDQVYLQVVEISLGANDAVFISLSDSTHCISKIRVLDSQKVRFFQIISLYDTIGRYRTLFSILKI